MLNHRKGHLIRQGLNLSISSVSPVNVRAIINKLWQFSSCSMLIPYKKKMCTEMQNACSRYYLFIRTDSNRPFMHGISHKIVLLAIMHDVPCGGIAIQFRTMQVGIMLCTPVFIFRESRAHTHTLERCIKPSS